MDDNSSSGIQTQNNDLSSIQIFPNPINNILNIRLLENTTSHIAFDIFSSFGEALFHGYLDSEITSIDFSKFKNGLYLSALWFGFRQWRYI